MAAPTLVRVPARGSSVVTLPIAGAPAGSKPSIATQVVTGLKQVFFTKASLQDPDNLYQVIQQLHDQLVSGLRAIRSCPIATGSLLKGVVFGSGQTLTLPHYLGRPFVDCFAGIGSGAAASLTVVANPAGVTNDKAISLTSANACTVNLWVF